MRWCGGGDGGRVGGCVVWGVLGGGGGGINGEMKEMKGETKKEKKYGLESRRRKAGGTLIKQT